MCSHMHTSLSLDGAAPDKPLLWKHGGHPRIPRTLDLCRLQQRLEALLCLVR